MDPATKLRNLMYIFGAHILTLASGPFTSWSVVFSRQRRENVTDQNAHGVMDVTKPSNFIWFGGIRGPKPHKFIGI